MSISSVKPLNHIGKGGFFTIFFLTGFSALIYQLIWQRVLAIHAGVDMYSVITIIAAFMAGLGIGSLIGGYIADRLNFRNCLVFFIASNFFIGIFGFFSLWLFYDVYNSLAQYLTNTVSSFLFHFVVLCIPTTLMGLSLPLLSKALVRTSDEMSSLIGALYGINTLGAAVGAGLGTWYLLGTFGFVQCIRIASVINIVCGFLALILLYRSGTKSSVSAESGEMHISDPPVAGDDEQWVLTNKPGHWILIYGLTGFAALSLEIVWFRILEVISRSNSYTFGHLLFIYLCGVGFGSLVSSKMIKRIKRPDKAFLWMQYAIGLLSLLSPLLLIYMPESFKITQYMRSLLSSRPDRVHDLSFLVKYMVVFNFMVIFIFGIATVMMGACFPLMQRIVSRRMESLGRNLSKLLFSNIVGNVLGTVITGFVLLDLFGTPATLKIISALLVIPGIVAGYYMKGVSRFISITLISLVSLITITTFPKEKEFWSFFHPYSAEDILIREDRISLNSLARKKEWNKYEVFTN
ncbi:MAG: fused MFS/spermidine synthase [Nitrospirae bacterium]|nr:fused MFS/spermidine synthase [Nitrospirota bacterium]